MSKIIAIFIGLILVGVIGIGYFSIIKEGENYYDAPVSDNYTRLYENLSRSMDTAYDISKTMEKTASGTEGWLGTVYAFSTIPLKILLFTIDLPSTMLSTAAQANIVLGLGINPTYISLISAIVMIIVIITIVLIVRGLSGAG